MLLDDLYLARRVGEVNTVRPTPTIDVKPGLPEHPNTTHFSIVDAWGNALSNTYTLDDWFGCGQVVSGAGFFLNNDMDGFSAKPGIPNLLGVIGGDANAIAAESRVAVVIGTPGGSRIATSIFQVLSNWRDYQMSLEAAIAAPRIHHQLLPADTLFEEPYATLDPTARQALIDRGYAFINQGWNGDIQVVVVAAAGTVAVSDPRGRGVARVLASPSAKRIN